MKNCFQAFGTAFLRGHFNLQKDCDIKIRISCDPTTYLKPYCMPRRGDGHDGGWLMGNSFIRFRLWFDGTFISCGPLRSSHDGDRIVHEFSLGTVSAGEHLSAVGFRGDRDGISIEIFAGDQQIEPEWKIFDARLFYAPIPWKCPQMNGYFKGNIGPGEIYEHIEGTLSPDGWNTDLSFDDSTWDVPRVVQCDLPERSAEFNYVVEIQEPVKIWKRENGNYVADFGQIAIGSIRLKGPDCGGEVELRLGEELWKNGQVRYEARAFVCYQELWNYRAGGQTLEHFGVRCFRYAELEGYQEELEPGAFRRVVISAPFSDSGILKTEHPYLPRIWNICRNTIRNITADYFVDCFTRERIPYEADTFLTIGASFVLNSDIRAAKRTLDYLLTHPTWPCDWALEMAILFYEYYMETGDVEFIRERFDRLLAYSGFRDLIQDGMIRKYPLTILVDWPVEYQQGYDLANSEYLTATNALSCKVLRLFSELASAIGRTELSAELQQESRNMAESINKKCFDPEKGLYKDRPESEHCSLYANMWALWCDIVPEKNIPSVLDFVEKYGMNCSLYSGYIYLETLFRYGRGKSAFALISGADSQWMKMIDAGLMSTPEYWHDPQEMISLAHPWGAYPPYLIARYVFGVKQSVPGWKEYVIEPDPSISFTGTLDMVRNGVVIHAERS